MILLSFIIYIKIILIIAYKWNTLYNKKLRLGYSCVNGVTARVISSVLQTHSRDVQYLCR